MMKEQFMRIGISLFPYFKRTLMLLAVIVIALSLPITILLLRNTQDVRQFAETPRGRTPSPTSTPTLGSIQATSEITNRQITIDRIDELKTLLRSWGVFAKTFQTAKNGRVEKNQVSQITIHLTSVKQPTVVVKNETTGEDTVTTNIILSSGKIDFYLNISDKVLGSADVQTIDSYADYAFLRSIYNYYTPAPGEKDLMNRSIALNRILDSLARSKKQFIHIQKI